MMRPRFASRFSFSALAAITLCASTGCNARSKEKTCTLLSISECSSRPYCVVLSAARVDSTERCLEPGEPVACMELADLDCGTALSVGRDPDEGEFVFGSTCVPAGWEDRTQDQPEIVNWPECE
jgi:hypothetical protein